jgi:hypothetical protein
MCSRNESKKQLAGHERYLFFNKWKGKLVVFEVPALIFVTIYQEKVRAAPAPKESSQWKMATTYLNMPLRQHSLSNLYKPSNTPPDFTSLMSPHLI